MNSQLNPILTAKMPLISDSTHPSLTDPSRYKKSQLFELNNLMLKIKLKTMPKPASVLWFFAVFMQLFASNSFGQTGIQFGGVSSDIGRSIAVDSLNNTYVIGDSSSSYFGTHNGTGDVFIIKYNSAGIVQWQQQIGTITYDWGNDIAIDASGDVYVVGETVGNLFGTNIGSRDAFIAKYDGITGVQQWARQFGSNGQDRATSLAIGSSNELYITGYAGGTFAGGSVNYGMFITKYDSSGNHLWAKKFGAFGYNPKVAVDSHNNAYITGSTTVSLFNPISGATDAIIVKYDSYGNQLWATQFGIGNDSGVDIAVSLSDDIYVTGMTTEMTHPAPASSGRDIFIIKYTSSGNEVWTQQFGSSTGEDSVEGIAVDSTGNIYVTGYTTGDLFDINAGRIDVFTAKYNSDGILLSKNQYGSSANDRALAIDVNASGYVCVTGRTQGDLFGSNARSNDVFISCETSEQTCPAVKYSVQNRNIVIKDVSMELYNPITDEFSGKYALFNSTDFSLDALPGFKDFKFSGANITYANLLDTTNNCYPSYSSKHERLYFPKIEVPLVSVPAIGGLVPSINACYSATFNQANTNKKVFTLMTADEIGCD